MERDETITERPVFHRLIQNDFLFKRNHSDVFEQTESLQDLLHRFGLWLLRHCTDTHHDLSLRRLQKTTCFSNYNHFTHLELRFNKIKCLTKIVVIAVINVKKHPSLTAETIHRSPTMQQSSSSFTTKRLETERWLFASSPVHFVRLYTFELIYNQHTGMTCQSPNDWTAWCLAYITILIIEVLIWITLDIAVSQNTTEEPQSTMSSAK